MVTVDDIARRLSAYAPAETAEEWDNVGLMTGSRKAQVSAVTVCLDVTDEALDFAQKAGASLIVTHHPLIFHPVRSVRTEDLLYRVIRSDMAVLSLHTNLDKAAGGVNDTLAEKLGLCGVTPAPDGMCRLGRLPSPMTAADFAAKTAGVLHTAVRFCDGGRPVERVAVCGGSGGDLLLPLCGKADAVVSGELRHHEWLALRRAGVTAVEAGHYATEVGVIETVAAWLTADFPELSVTVFSGEEPYRTCMPDTEEE